MIDFLKNREKFVKAKMPEKQKKKATKKAKAK